MTTPPPKRRPIHKWTDAELEQLCKTGIPGYDPWASAGTEYVFDVAKARRALRFFYDVLVFVEGEWAGKPFELQPWQAAIVANLFGWVAADTKLRRYREVFVFIPRKNGKTSLAAGIVLYLLVCDGEMGAQVYSAAADREQAALIFRHAMQMVLLQPHLEARCRPYRSFKSIEVGETGSIYKALSADANTKHGLNTHGVVIDELHAHPTRDLVDVLQTSVGSRRQPVIFHITTSDFDRPGSICNEKYMYARSVRDGTLPAPRFLPVIYEATRQDDWKDPAVWRRANPNLGVSISQDAIALECAKAEASPAYLNTFLRLHLNVRTSSNVALITPDRWASCAGDEDWRALCKRMRGKRCFGGLDLASTKDLAAFALWFPEERVLLVWCWVPRDSAITRERHDRVPYTVWAREGALSMTGTGPREDAISYATIRKDIVELAREFDIQEVAFDRYGANETVTALRDDHGIEVIDFGQGYVSMNAPTKEFERLVRAGDLRHGGHPVLTWCVGNLVVVQDDADCWKPSKRKSTERIDPVVASIMAIGASMLQSGDVVPWVSHVGGEAPPAPRQDRRDRDDEDERDADEGERRERAGAGGEPVLPPREPEAAQPPESPSDRALREWLLDDE